MVEYSADVANFEVIIDIDFLVGIKVEPNNIIE